MDLLKSSSLFTAVELQRSQFTDDASSKLMARGYIDDEKQTVNRDTQHALAGLSVESIEVSDQAGILADPGGALIMLQVWQGDVAGNRSLTPSIPAPLLESSLTLIEARNCLSSYVLSAFQ